MSVPMPESPDTSALISRGGLVSPEDAAAVSKAGASAFSVPAMLAALKAPAPFPSAANVPQVGNASKGGAVDLKGAAKNIIDFMETPFYMLTNTLDSHFTREDNGNPDPNSIGSMLDDARQGIQKGWEGGVNHDPNYTKDWVDVIKHAQQGTPDEGKDAQANTLGFGADLAIDPLNAAGDLGGVGKSLVKAPFVAAGAAREAGKAAATKVAEGADLVAKGAVEPIADDIAKTAAKPAEALADGAATDAGKVATEAPVAPPAAPAQGSAAASAVADFKGIPQIAAVLKSQDMGKVQSVLSALGKEFGTNFADSDIGKIMQGFKEGYSPAEKSAFLKPIPVSPDSILQAHLEGINDKEGLAKEPVANMGEPDKVKEPSAASVEKADAVKPDTATVDKKTDIVNSAAANTLERKSWADMSADERQATRMGEAKLRSNSLSEPLPVKRIDNSKGFFKETQQRNIVNNMVNDAKAYQTGRDLKAPKETKEGYLVPSKKDELQGIRHPLLYDTHAQMRPFQRALDEWGNFNEYAVKANQAKLSPYQKPEYVTKMTKAADAQLEAAGMIPTFNLSKYAEKDGYIHLTQGDVLEASLAKSVDGINGKSTFTKNDILKHIIGPMNELKNSVNPMALNTAMETLLHERRLIMEEIKKKGAAMLPDDLEKLLNKSKQNIKDVLMGESKAYGPQATKADIANIKKTATDAAAARGKGGAKSYEKDMDTLANKIIRDPHLGTMLEQRHLYNQAMHSADLEKFVAGNWDKLKSNLMSIAAGPWTPKQTLDWLNTQTRDTKNLLPLPDRERYSDWIADLKKQIITPAEEKAVKAVSPKTTLTDSGKDSKALLDSEALKTGDMHTDIDIHTAQIAADVIRAIHPVKSFFDAKFPFLATSGFYNTVMMGKHSQGRMQSQAHRVLDEYFMKYPKDGLLLEDTKAVIKSAVDRVPVEGESARFLKNYLNSIFNTDARYIRAIQDGTVSKDFLKEVLKSPKYDGLFDRISPRWWAKADSSNLHLFWQHFDLKDSEQTADTISKMFGAVMDINSKLTLTKKFEADFASAVPKEGFSRISWNSGRGVNNGLARVGSAPRAAAEVSKTGFFDLLDKSLYYDRAAAWEIPSIHRLVNESRNISDKTLLGRFVNNVFDPITQVMKATQTTLRPGHWVSNVNGDVIRNFLAGVTDPRSYAYNMRILSAIGRDEQLFANGIGSKLERATMLAGGQYAKKIPVAERKYMVPIRINGTVKYYTATELGRMLEDKIFISPHGVGQHEDYLTAEDRGPSGRFAQALLKGTDKALTNNLYDLNKWSAVRDNLTRGALAVDTLIHGDHASIEDALDKAFTRVRKWAPTSADFTREESVYARRTLMYYTWLRGMIPNIIETMVNKPGVFMAPNKALYGMAKVNGVDPMSVGNPFPINQQFPNYYYENVIGPQFKTEGGQLWGFSPMAPSLDVLDTILKPNVGANVLGMANPFIKMPIEAVTGQSNGIPIKDNAQYLQDNILPPQLDMISKGTGQELYNPMQNRTDKGNSQPVPGTGIPADVFNFFTGLHATDFNSNPDLRSVAAENKNAKSAIRSDAQRAAR